jgi:hypothetical protein
VPETGYRNTSKEIEVFITVRIADDAATPLDEGELGELGNPLQPGCDVVLLCFVEGARPETRDGTARPLQYTCGFHATLDSRCVLR